jgi:hypothetical protein
VIAPVLTIRCAACGHPLVDGTCACTREWDDWVLCLCGSWRRPGHDCAYTRGEGWCTRCLADHGDPECCTLPRLARVLSVDRRAWLALLAEVALSETPGPGEDGQP